MRLLQELREDDRGSAYAWVMFLVTIVVLTFTWLVVGNVFKYMKPIAEDLIGDTMFWGPMETMFGMSLWYPVIGVFGALLGLLVGIIIRESVRR